MRAPRWLLAVAALTAAASTVWHLHSNAADTYGVWVFLDPHAAQSTLPYIAPPGAEPFENDRPINPQLVDAVAATGAEIRYQSRWLRAISVNATRATLKKLRAMPQVIALQPIADAYPLSSSRLLPSLTFSPVVRVPHHPLISAGDSAFHGQAYPPLRELRIDILHTLGFTGLGQRIAIFDTGFNLRHESLLPLRIGRQRDFINDDDFVFNEANDPVSPNQELHGTRVWSLLGGYKPGVFVSGAYDATFYLAKVDIEGIDTRGDEDRWVEAAEWAYTLDVKIINSSIGFRYDFIDRDTIPLGDLDGNKTVTTRAADEAARRGILVVVAIGDGRPQQGSLEAPADADSVLVVGGIDFVRPSGAIAASANSNRGPTGNQGVRPDVVARGDSLIAASVFSPLQYEKGITGSSYATPLITAGAALYRQAWPNDPPIAIRQALQLSASNVASRNNQVGYGVPDFASAVMMPDGLQARSISSQDVQGGLTTVRPTFSWSAIRIHPSTGDLVYRLDIATDPAFNNLIYTDTVKNAQQLTVRRPLRPALNAFWRVTAESGLGVRRTTLPQPRFFIPHWVTLLTYTGTQREETTQTHPVLQWTSLANPDTFKYEVQVLTTSGVVVQSIPNLTTSTLRVPTALSANQAYKWRVIARSGVFADTVESGNAPFLVVSTEAPPATVLYPPFPVPFRAGQTMRVWFDVGGTTSQPVQLSIYTSRGALVRNLLPARTGCAAIRLSPGQYGRPGGAIESLVANGCASLDWDGRDMRGNEVAGGHYIVRLRAGSVVTSQIVMYQRN